jgi:hypothetical protein
MLNLMTFNSGHGRADQATCTAMAERFERWLEWQKGLTVESKDRVYVTGMGRLFTRAEAAQSGVGPAYDGGPVYGVGPVYKVVDDFLKKWVEFLRHCGGFEVW